MVLGKLDSHVQDNETVFLSFIIYKTQLKMDKDLNIKPKATKLLKENIESKCLDGLGYWFSEFDIKSKENKQKNSQVGTHQTKKLFSVKIAISKMERQFIEWKKIFSNHILNKGLIYKTYKELIQLNRKTKQTKTSIRIKNGWRNWEGIFPKSHTDG